MLFTLKWLKFSVWCIRYFLLLFEDPTPTFQSSIHLAKKISFGIFGVISSDSLSMNVLILPLRSCLFSSLQRKSFIFTKYIY